MEALFFGLSGGMVILLLLILIGPTILWFWALIDCLTSRLEAINKLIWVILILLLPFIGAILYLLIGRKQKI